MDFNLIPIDLLTPGHYAEINNNQAFRGLSGIPTKALVIGQKLAGGSAQPLQPLLITNVDQAKAYFGTGSVLALMIERYKKVDGTIECHAIAQDDEDTGVAATGSIAFTGPATAAGALNLYVSGRRVRIGVSSGQAATAIATATAAAINADTDLPVSAAVDGEDTHVVNLTAKNKGEVGNQIPVLFNFYADEMTPAGLGHVVTALAGGAASPEVTDVLDAIGDAWYTDFVMPYLDGANQTAMKDELERRWGPMVSIDGMCWMAERKSHAQLVSAGLTRNTHTMSYLGHQGAPMAAFEWAAAYAAACTFALKNDPARPVQTRPLTGLLPPPVTSRFTREERNILLQNGISTFTVDEGGVVRIERAVTAYRRNATGAVDRSYLDVETVKTLSYLRFDLRNWAQLRFPDFKLASDGTPIAPGQRIVTPKTFKAALAARLRQWGDHGLIENVEWVIENTVVERDANDPNRLNILLPADIINQLRVAAYNIEFRL